MILRLGMTLQARTRHIQLRGNVYQFAMRVPVDLVKRYGHQFIRKSLKTSDQRVAIREAERLARQYSAQFDALRGNQDMTPADVMHAARALADEWVELELLVDHVLEPKRIEYAEKSSADPQRQQEAYHEAELSDFLTPVELTAMELLKEGPGTKRLSDAFTIYKKTHQRAGDERFMARAQRDWDKLIAVVGDCAVDKVARADARRYIEHCLQEGQKTGTIRRCLSQITAIFSAALREWELARTNPFQGQKILNEGQDEQKREVASPAELAEMIAKFKDEPSETAMLIILQIHTGARIGELAGLAVSDVVLDHATPHIHIRPQPWRGLKTKSSSREVPLVGLGLEAAKKALALPREANGLFQKYARERGADTASAAVNKRLKPWGLTSHSFRHTLKDLLREVDCPKDIRDLIQGHAARDIAEIYGKGHSLQAKKGWLEKIPALQEA